MHDALIGIGDIEERDAGFACGATRFRDECLTARHQGSIVTATPGIDDVVHDTEDARWIGDRAAGFTQTVQCGGAGAFVQENAVDSDQVDATVEGGDDVLVPQPGEQCGWLGQRRSSSYLSYDCQSRLTSRS
ncbi:hypothetical protein GCM10011487_24140 [Steroidobacter agaridevorans]|uniref:Uncharacterized protein n=1 Tax=Steroidobacter agaridevorans TaxID=2695856 RepID=A0A829YAP0_9GAMM|nr:hypothetical protein GCM10011487_24140 [Steroidobacter agaridevorans]GFE87470.1 hypothetical protein GCM10011488_24240 [Steroidobacter agaridevorans]